METEFLRSGIFPSSGMHTSLLINNFKLFRPPSAPVTIIKIPPCIKHPRVLPICSKIFERLIYHELFIFFTDNNLISPNQSGFKPADSCVNQLIAITHEIYKSFNDGLEVRGVFLDIS